MLQTVWIDNLATLDGIDQQASEFMLELASHLNTTMDVQLLDLLICGSYARQEFVPHNSDIDFIALTSGTRPMAGIVFEPSEFKHPLSSQFVKIDVAFRGKYEACHFNSLPDLIRMADSISLFTGAKYKRTHLSLKRLAHMLRNHQAHQLSQETDANTITNRRQNAKHQARRLQLRLLEEYGQFSFSLQKTLQVTRQLYPDQTAVITALEEQLGYVHAR